MVYARFNKKKRSDTEGSERFFYLKNNLFYFNALSVKPSFLNRFTTPISPPK
jgi:hypothetical protein